MAVVYLFLALLIQNTLTETILNETDNSLETFDILDTKNIDDIIKTKSQEVSNEWTDAFIESSSTLFPTSSVTLMTQAALSDKSPEERLENIKEMANQIKLSLQNETANLLSYAMSCTDNDEIDNHLKKKRCIETPMDSSQLVMTLLKQIKCSNEFQNNYINEMMSAQEIGDKYGISFTPDHETLTNLALAANEQAKEMSAILRDVIDMKNITQKTQETPKLVGGDQINFTEILDHIFDNDNPKMLENIEAISSECMNKTLEQDENKQQNTTDQMVNFEIPIHNDSNEHPAASYYNFYNTNPVETQIMPPPPHQSHAPVSQRPNFYDFVSYSPTEDFYCSVEPATTTIILSHDEPVEAERELMAEEYEETLSSKVYINHEEAPDVSTVNHVMSYTISEKAHFRTPQIESLPQQMQYYFLLM